MEAEAVVMHLQAEGPEDAAAREAGEKRELPPPSPQEGLPC